MKNSLIILATKQLMFLLIAVMLFLLSTAISLAVPIIEPSSLNPGDQYRLAFVTSSTSTASSSDWWVYNAFVTNIANSVPELEKLSTNWKVIASAGGIRALDNTETAPWNPSVPIYNLAGQMVANNNDDLWDGNLDAPIAFDEFGRRLEVAVWTGSRWNGTRYPWMTLGEESIMQGFSGSNTASWIESHAMGHIYFHNFYAISGILEKGNSSPIPEPTTILLISFGLLSLVGYSIHRKKKS